ncbi:MAG: hypothetical protein ACJAXA_000157 [Candidatus Aldehydirespiratoraceae bacterium]|jgi:hypothetical protein
MNRALVATVATFTMLAAATTAFAQEETPPEMAAPRRFGDVEMVLIDQSFDLAPNGTIELTYRLSGDLAAAAELTLPSTVPATTEPPSTTMPAQTVTPETTSVTTIDPTAPTTFAAVPAPTTVPPSTTLPPPIALSIRVLNYRALDDVDDLRGILGPNPSRDRPNPIDGVDIFDIRSSIVVESADEAILTLTVPTDTDISVAEQLEFNTDGIHPIMVELRVADIVVARHGTVVERRSEGRSTPPPIDLALFTSIDDPGPTASDTEVARAVEQFADLIDIADELAPSLALDVPPSVVTAAAGQPGFSDSSEILRDDELLAGPATPFNVSSATAADQVDAFINQLNAGEDDVATAIGKTPTRDVWLTTTELSGAGALVLRNLGVRYLAMPMDLYMRSVANDAEGEPPAVDQFVEIELPDGSSMPIILLDQSFGAAFTRAATDEILANQTPLEWSVQTIAALRLEQYTSNLARQRQDRSHLVATPDLGPFDTRLLVELDRFASTTDAIEFTPAGMLTAVTSTQFINADVTLPESAGPSLEPRLERITQIETSLASVATMLRQDDPRQSEWARLLDSFVSTAFSDTEVEAALRQLLAEADALRAGVVAPDPFTFTLTGREGDIKVRIGNDLDEPLNVIVRLSSPRLAFPAGDIPVTLLPDSITIVDVPVEARSNGTTAAIIEILTPSLSEDLIEPVTLTARVNALTGLGQVLTGAFVLILLTWWLSHWRRRRTEDAETALSSDD